MCDIKYHLRRQTNRSGTVGELLRAPLPETNVNLFLDRNMMVIFTITLVGVQGVSSITPVLPVVAREYGITPQEAAWLVVVFTLPGVLLAPITGVLADRLGRKKVLVPSLVLFAVAGTACTFAGSFEHLLILRALQGIGAAALGSLNATLIGDIFTGHRRVTAMGYNAGVISAAAAAYPLIGGALALVSWRYPFLLPLIALPVALLVVVALKNPEPEHSDTLGRYLRQMATTFLKTEIVVMLFAGFIVFVLLYGGLIAYLPFFLERDFGTTPFEFGIVLAANSAAGAAASMALGALAKRFSRKGIVLFAFAMMSFPMMAIPFMPSLWLIAMWIAMIGAAMSVGLAIIQAQLAEMAQLEQRAAVMAINGMMFRLGQTVGPVTMGVFLALAGMEAVFVGAGLIGILTGFLLAVFMHRDGETP